MISHDPSIAPDLPLGAADLARGANYQVIAVTCMEHPEPEAANKGETLQFHAATPFIPNVGNKIAIEKGRVCEVTEVIFKIKMVGLAEGGTLPVMVPNVVARLMPEDTKLGIALD